MGEGGGGANRSEALEGSGHCFDAPYCSVYTFGHVHLLGTLLSLGCSVFSLLMLTSRAGRGRESVAGVAHDDGAMRAGFSIYPLIILRALSCSNSSSYELCYELYI